jgi:hypothetical protein
MLCKLICKTTGSFGSEVNNMANLRETIILMPIYLLKVKK